MDVISDKTVATLEVPQPGLVTDIHVCDLSRQAVVQSPWNSCRRELVHTDRPTLISASLFAASTSARIVGMYVEDFDSFYQQAEELYRSRPLDTRYCIKYRNCDGKLVVKVTDDRTCLQFKTDQQADIKKLERLNNLFFALMAKGDTTPEDLAAMELQQQPVLSPQSQPAQQQQQQQQQQHSKKNRKKG